MDAMIMKKLLLLLALLGTASAQTITGTITASSGSGVCSPSTACVSLALPTVASAVSVGVTGAFNATLQFEVSADNTTFVSVQGILYPAGSPASSTTSAGIWIFPSTASIGMISLRVRASAFTSGPISVTITSITAGSITAASSNGSCSPSTSCLSLALPGTTPAVSVVVTGNFSATLQFEATADNATWVGVQGTPQPNGWATSYTTTAGTWIFPSTAGKIAFRVRGSTFRNGPINVIIQGWGATPNGIHRRDLINP
jgi:hypothetical protein